ncbi:MAG: hypothetical protein KJN93_09290 [Alphaproteobacteria bacterium]|nr:hypothetical protein [Alphaproteobacteria bacterium]
MSGVLQINHSEYSRLDRDRLEVLVSELGEPGAERIVGRALEELAVWLNRTDRAYRKSDMATVVIGAEQISRIAMQVGLSTLNRVARDVAQSCETGDTAALSATLARMMRIGECALLSVWDIQDMSL